MLKIVRRLELRAVEQKCWRFLLSIVNQENCVQLHQIADFFECAPLKISAWRIIQESKPGYGSAPDHMISSMRVNANSANMHRSHGLTGPGEMDALSNQDHGHDDDSDDEDDAEFSIFTATTPTGLQSDMPDEGLLGSINKRYDHYIHPDKLPKGTPAAQVVKAWSFRLQEVFAECCDQDSSMNIVEHAEMSAAASVRSDTENVMEEEDVQRQISAFSDGSFAEKAMSTQSNNTPILSPPRKSVVGSQRAPRAGRKSAAVKFSSVKETSEVSVDGRAHEEELHQENGGDYSNMSPLDWRVELTNFYIANNLEEKIQSIDAILEAWHGRELDMMEVLHDKYNVHFDEDLRNRLSQEL